MTSIRIERRLPADPALVFQAWTLPSVMDDWMCPNPDLVVTAHADAREGGVYRVNMGGEYIVTGTYVRLEAPAVLECTWRWEHETLTTALLVELAPAEGGGTRLVLTHADFTDEEDAASTQEGWELSLSRLESLLA